MNEKEKNLLYFKDILQSKYNIIPDYYNISYYDYYNRRNNLVLKLHCYISELDKFIISLSLYRDKDIHFRERTHILKYSSGEVNTNCNKIIYLFKYRDIL